MILLTRLNGLKFLLNAELVKTVECSPDTTITLIGGEKLIVLESLDEVINSVVTYRRAVSAIGEELKLPSQAPD